jgi:hypothetical protein
MQIIARASGVGVRASGKKGVESRVSGIKNVLTVLAVAIDAR